MNQQDVYEFQEPLIPDNFCETPICASTQDSPLSIPYSIAYSRIIGNRVFHQNYKILKLGYYPGNTKLTKKTPSTSMQYKIPDKYKMETRLSGFEVTCQTKYMSSGLVRYCVSMKDENGQMQTVHSDKSASDAGNLFSTVSSSCL